MNKENSSEQKNDRNNGYSIVGFALFGGFGIGILATIISLCAALYEDFVGSGVLLIAAALSFGAIILSTLTKN